MTRHLVHIGYPKAGSTFLQGWFAAHPQIAYVEGGVAGLHTIYDLARDAAGSSVDPAWRVTSSEELVWPNAMAGGAAVRDYSAGETTVADGQRRVCRSLADLFPQAHILIVTRGFRAVMLSSYSQYVRTGGTMALAELYPAGGFNFWDYDRLIALYREAFGGRVIALPYELLARDPAAFLHQLAGRLGVDASDFAGDRVNPSLSAAELRWYPRLGRLMRRGPGRWWRPWVGAVFAGRLRRVAAVLDRLAPASASTADPITDAALERMRGSAAELVSDPIFAPYAKDYLQP